MNERESKPPPRGSPPAGRAAGFGRPEPTIRATPPSEQPTGIAKAIVWFVAGYFMWFMSMAFKRRVEVDHTFSRTDGFASRDPIVRAYATFTGLWLIAVGLVVLYQTGLAEKMVWVWHEIRNGIFHPTRR